MCVHLEFDHKKATQALNFFARKSGGRINKMKAIKLIYFADRYHLRKYGRPVTNDEYFAMEYGPVNSGVKDIAEMSDFLGRQEKEYAERFIRTYDQYTTESLGALEEEVFSETDIEALEFSWCNFGRYDKFGLVDLSHKYPEWKKHEAALQVLSRVRMNYEDFFQDPPRGIEKCHELDPKDRAERIEEIKETAHLEALWR